MLPKTLTFRLVATSIVWVALSLTCAGLLLAKLFGDHLERRFDLELYEHIEELAASSEISLEGFHRLTWIPTEPRFRRPHSGWYWQITRGETIKQKSQSLWHDHLPVVNPAPGAQPQVRFITGPGDQALRALVQDITLPRANTHFAFVVAGPIDDIKSDVDRFVAQLAVTLSVLGLGLLAAVFFQVRFGLRPLRSMQHALADIRSGRAHHLPENFPEELEPVITELNALLDHNAAMLERARTQAGNLAHAIKNPLTVIGNEIRNVKGEQGRLLRDQVCVVTEHINRYLSRARAAGSGGVLGARASIKETLEELRFSMELLHKDRGVTVSVQATKDLCFRGDRHDLEEMIGNLMDNACKWARSRVVVSASIGQNRILIGVEDDGPGIPENRREEVLRRGRKLDETVHGAGLGLDIVQEIAQLYRGSLKLKTSSLGGVYAVLELPAAE
jgi:signal transduction histidine kinase